MPAQQPQQQTAPADDDENQLLAKALIALATPAAGFLLGGEKGALAGGAAGLGALGKAEQHEADRMAKAKGEEQAAKKALDTYRKKLEIKGEMDARTPKEPTLVKVETTDEKGKPVTKFVRPDEAASFPKYVKPKELREKKEPKLVLIDDVDEKGNKVKRWVTPAEGETYKVPVKPPKEDAKAKRSKEELSYRYNILKKNADKLKKLVKKVGTVEMFGPEGTEMDMLIYQMAVDYAKMVDPDSVAREGEVASAQKYMLPFREDSWSTRNVTAEKQIDNYIKSLDERLAARTKASEKPSGSDLSKSLTNEFKTGGHTISQQDALEELKRRGITAGN